MFQLQKSKEDDIQILPGIPKEWKIAILNELSKKITDIDHKMPKKIDKGIPFLSVGYLAKNETPFLELRKEIDGLEFISQDDYEYHSKKFNAEYGDLLYSRFGTIGIAKLINNHEKMIASYSVVLIKPKQDLIIPLFLTYILNSVIVRKQAKIMTQGSSNQNFHLSDIKILKIPVPPISEQQKIASILLKVDDLIQKTDQVIEQTQRLKKGLMQRLLTKGIGHTKFKKTSIGEIPEEWELVNIGDIISLEYGKGLTENQRTHGNYPVFGSNGIVGFHNRFLVNGPGIIVGRKGSIGETVWSNQDFWPIDTTYYAKLKKDDLSLKWLYFLLIHTKLKQLNTSTSIPGLNRNDVYSKKIGLPNYSEQQKIEYIISNNESSIQRELDYKTKVRELKTGLMQKLLTGKIRVKV